MKTSETLTEVGTENGSGSAARIFSQGMIQIWGEQGKVMAPLK